MKKEDVTKTDTSSQPEQSKSSDESIVHDISVEEPVSEDMPAKTVAIIFTLVIIVGIASGFGASYIKGATGGSSAKSSSETSSTESLSGKKDVIESAGIADKETFKDSAEGKLEEKDEDDYLEEGSYKLVRPGGDSQTVHVTSSTVDLSDFVGKNVRIYGETFASEKVGWLMDVGFIEVTK